MFIFLMYSLHFTPINRAILSSISIQPYKKMKMSAAAVALAFALVLANFANQCHGALQEGFYKGKCNVDVEKIVSNIITPLVGQKPWITPALLRMQFHDCFVKVNSYLLICIISRFQANAIRKKTRKSSS